MSLFTKLRFKTAAPVHVLGDAAGQAIVQAEEGYSLARMLPEKKGAGVQQVILFARDAASLQKEFTCLAPHLADAAVLWIAYPKKSGAIQSDLTRDRGWKVVDEWGYIGVSQASLNADWSGLWYKKPEALRSFKRGTPMEDRITEGVDYKSRTVSLPADAAEALNPVPGLQDFFASFSFSHKREWVEAIADAKKPETRARRIAKMVEDLEHQREQKAAKAAAKTTA
jgi:hypothetical protein